ncbi:MAG: CoA transferase [Deltaproteobacteria bacterium]|nr:CoA transferase [Deltaproteobacteria bacterium]HCH63861.1 CoA transferase [Deltaproteobacteria bacterium]
MGPLAGLKVVELAGLGPAPCAGMMLADMGAEVVLIERKTRNANAASIDGMRAGNFVHRGKRSIAVDLKNPASTDVVLRLIERADVVVEGFRPGVMERLGLGPTVCHARNPKLVYGRLTGWGQTGPLAHAAGHDPNYIALSGALWHGGSADRPPTAPLTLVGDLGGGTMMLLFGLLGAVFHAARTGEGQVVDCAITDGSAYLSSLLWTMRNVGVLGGELGSSWADFGAPWNDTYRCADGGFVTVCALEPRFYALLIEQLGLSDDPLFAHQWDRTAWPAAKARMQECFATHSRAHWCALLEGTDACFAPVLDPVEAAQHPHNVAREVFIERDGHVQPAPAPRFSRSVPEAGPIPSVGSDADAILAELGYNAAAIAGLRETGAV